MSRFWLSVVGIWFTSVTSLAYALSVSVSLGLIIMFPFVISCIYSSHLFIFFDCLHVLFIHGTWLFYGGFWLHPGFLFMVLKIYIFSRILITLMAQRRSTISHLQAPSCTLPLPPQCRRSACGWPTQTTPPSCASTPARPSPGCGWTGRGRWPARGTRSRDSCCGAGANSEIWAWMRRSSSAFRRTM